MAQDKKKKGRRGWGLGLAWAAFAAANVGLAGVCGYGSLRLLWRYGDVLADAASQRPDEIEIAVAAHDLPMGVAISEVDLVRIPFRIDYVPPGSITSLEDLVGRTPIERILAWEVIRGERIAPDGAGDALDAIVPRGMRAEAINIDGSSRVSGFIEPSNWVDVIATYADEDGRPAQTETLLRGARVLAVDDRMGVQGTGDVRIKRRQVILALTPEEAQRIAHADAVAKIHLTLRSDIDFAEVPDRGPVTTPLLLGGSRWAPRMTVTEWRERYIERPQPTVVTIIGGDEVRTERTGGR